MTQTSVQADRVDHLPEPAGAADFAASAAAPAAVGLWLPTWTLWRREMVRFFRQPNRVVSALVTPVIFWLMLGAGLNKAFALSPPAGANATGAGATGGVGYMVYFFPGTITMILLFTAIFSTITVIEDRREGFLQGVLVSPAPRLAIVLGKVLGGASIAMIHALVFLIIWPFVGPWPGVGPMLGAIAVMIVTSTALTGLGLCIAWPMTSTAGFHAVMMLFLMPMWFLSGAVFPVGSAPVALKVVMLANPLTYGQAVLSSVLTGGAAGTGVPLPVWASGLIGLGCTAAILWLAALLVARPRKDGLP